MLWAQRDRYLDVGLLAAFAERHPTVTNQRLSKLQFAGLVDAIRQGGWMLYRLRGDHVGNLLIEALFHADYQVIGERIYE
jgi:DNA-binding transcriptional ArsR family regulator